MSNLVKFLQNIQQITATELNILTADGQLQSLNGQPSTLKLPSNYLIQLNQQTLTPGIFMLPPNSQIHGALLVLSNESFNIIAWQNINYSSPQHLKQVCTTIWFGLYHQWPNINEALTEELPLPEHIFKNHNSYSLEKKMLMAVRQGNDEEYHHFFSQLTASGEFGKVANGQLRNQKNLLICSITLLSRQAIEGGLAPSEAFAISDRLCQQVETLNSIDNLEAFHQEVAHVFIQRIKQHQAKQTSKMGLLTQKIELSLRQHCGDKRSLDDLAKELHHDKYYLAHLYKQETGQTIGQYENSYRISKFKSRLLWTNQPITEIAAELGFATVSYASRLFKKLVGISPQKYRQRHQITTLIND